MPVIVPYRDRTNHQFSLVVMILGKLTKEIKRYYLKKWTKSM